VLAELRSHRTVPAPPACHWPVIVRSRQKHPAVSGFVGYTDGSAAGKS
jgi:hypothetical protein